MLAVLRRVTGLVPLQPTRDSHGRDDDLTAAVEHAATSAALAAPLALLSPAWTPGVCWHEGHIESGGQRYGVTPHRGHLTAALTRCAHTGPGGR